MINEPIVTIERIQSADTLEVLDNLVRIWAGLHNIIIFQGDDYSDIAARSNFHPIMVEANNRWFWLCEKKFGPPPALPNGEIRTREWAQMEESAA